MLIASIREVGECLVYRTSWLLGRPRGVLALRRSGMERGAVVALLRTQTCTRRIFRGVKHEAGVGETKARVHSTKY